jgi:hypothetical protein
MKKLSQSPYNKVLGNIALLGKFNFRLFHSHSPIFPFTSSATKLSLKAGAKRRLQRRWLWAFMPSCRYAVAPFIFI